MNELHIYTHIGTIDGKRGFLPSDMQKFLSRCKSYEVNIYINSPGGDVYDGYNIYEQLVRSGKKVNIFIEGICASIATVIALAGNKIYITDSSEFMIHLPLGGMQGNADQLRKLAGELDRITLKIAGMYASRTGMSIEAVQDMMRQETYLSADEAVQLKFVDEKLPRRQAVAFVDVNKLNQKSNNMSLGKKILQKLNSLEQAISATSAKVVNMEATLSDGTKVFIKTQNEGVITPGDEVMIIKEDGSQESPKDGEHITASGEIIVTASGKVVEVKEAEEILDKKKYEETMQQNAELTAKVNELTQALNEVKTQILAKDELIKVASSEIAQIKAMIVSEPVSVTTKVNQVQVEPKTQTVFDRMAELARKEYSN